jgi:hypothetical protein
MFLDGTFDALAGAERAQMLLRESLERRSESVRRPTLCLPPSALGLASFGLGLVLRVDAGDIVPPLASDLAGSSERHGRIVADRSRRRVFAAGIAGDKNEAFVPLSVTRTPKPETCASDLM